MKQKKTIDIGLILVLFFLICFIYTYVTGCMNIYKRNQLEQYGEPVQVTVVNKEPGGLDESDIYTFSYHYKGKQYTCQDSPDHTIHVGETVEMYIDPAKPEELVFISDNLPISFILFLFAIMMAWLTTPKFQFIKRHLLTVTFVMEAILIITAALLRYTGLLIAGILLAVVTFFARRFIQKIGTMHAADSQSLAEEMQKP